MALVRLIVSERHIFWFLFHRLSCSYILNLHQPKPKSPPRLTLASVPNTSVSARKRKSSIDWILSKKSMKRKLTVHITSPKKGVLLISQSTLNRFYWRIIWVWLEKILLIQQYNALRTFSNEFASNGIKPRKKKRRLKRFKRWKKKFGWVMIIWRMRWH